MFSTLGEEMLANPKTLYKTTIVVWSTYRPDNLNLVEIGECAIDGDIYCSTQLCYETESYEDNIEWDGTDFFKRPSNNDDDDDGA
jgi:hypothetical protein